MDYNNEWRPVGRGDPLKNDPTFDYSPPVLDRVRYWAADNSEKDGKSNKDVKAYNKKDVLMLGSPSSSTAVSLAGSTKANDHYRGAATLSSYHAKYAKADMPVLSPKYNSIRRSYYGQNLPTHLMPPPMQHSGMSDTNANHIMRNDYRSHMMSAEYNAPMSSTIGTAHNAYSKPYYSTAATAMHSSTYNGHRLPMSPSPREAVHSESMNHYVSYMNRMNTAQPEQYVSRPNSIGHQSMVRKPWLHELLQKELIKTTHAPMKNKIISSSNAVQYNQPKTPYEFVKPTHAPIYNIMSSTYNPPAPMYSSAASMHTSASTSTTTTSTSKPSTVSPIYITSTTTPVYSSTREYTTSTTQATPSTTSRRLLIPETSNLAFRPTIASTDTTTDPLFKHYNQKPLHGPMYLIIEGHSKVKSYGKNEIDPHQPKIVPIIPKREPIVRVADPNEKRGTVETFQVKHLHTKTEMTESPKKPTKSMTTTAKPSSTTTRPSTTITTTTRATTTTKTTAKPITTSTNKPLETSSENSKMDSILSFLGDLFNEEPLNKTEVRTNVTTILKPVGIGSASSSTTIKPAISIDARLGTHALDIQATQENEADDEENITTEPAPREVRQVFDYDQLPESRIKDMQESASENDELYADEDEDEFEWSDYDTDDTHKLIKRIDNLAANSEEENQFDILDLEEEDEELDLFGRERT